jgi:hypothetical protein
MSQKFSDRIASDYSEIQTEYFLQASLDQSVQLTKELCFF